MKERQEKVSKELRALTSRLERVQQEITNLQQQRGRFSRELEAGGDDEGLANRILNMASSVVFSYSSRMDKRLSVYIYFDKRRGVCIFPVASILSFFYI